MGVVVSPFPPLTGSPVPADNAMLAWTCDPVIAPTSASAGTGGTLYLNAVYPTAGTSSHVWFNIATPGSVPTAGQSFLGLYTAAGVLAASAGADATVTGTGLQELTWAAPVAVVPAMYWIGVLYNATTLPQLTRSSTSLQAAMNANLGPSLYRTCTNGTGLTALPATISPAANSNGGSLQPYWLGLS